MGPQNTLKGSLDSPGLEPPPSFALALALVESAMPVTCRRLCNSHVRATLAAFPQPPIQPQDCQGFVPGLNGRDCTPKHATGTNRYKGPPSKRYLDLLYFSQVCQRLATNPSIPPSIGVANQCHPARHWHQALSSKCFPTQPSCRAHLRLGRLTIKLGHRGSVLG